MYTCRDANEHITDGREGALTGWTGFWHRLHMTICPYCRACRRQMDEAVALAKEAPRQEVPPAMMEAALEAFRRRGE
ncbi:MAG: hypothetical protein ACRELB_10995 [Polyangiaceae bacterium]